MLRSGQRSSLSGAIRVVSRLVSHRGIRLAIVQEADNREAAAAAVTLSRGRDAAQILTAPRIALTVSPSDGPAGPEEKPAAERRASL